MKCLGWLKLIRHRNPAVGASLTVCPTCDEEVILADKTTTTGSDMRSYRCERCSKEHVVNFGPALWQVSRAQSPTVTSRVICRVQTIIFRRWFNNLAPKPNDIPRPCRHTSCCCWRADDHGRWALKSAYGAGWRFPASTARTPFVGDASAGSKIAPTKIQRSNPFVLRKGNTPAFARADDLSLSFMERFFPV